MADIISFKDWVKNQDKAKTKKKFSRLLLKPHKVIVKGRPSKLKRLRLVDNRNGR